MVTNKGNIMDGLLPAANSMLDDEQNGALISIDRRDFSVESYGLTPFPTKDVRTNRIGVDWL